MKNSQSKKTPEPSMRANGISLHVGKYLPKLTIFLQRVIIVHPCHPWLVNCLDMPLFPTKRKKLGLRKNYCQESHGMAPRAFEKNGKHMIIIPAYLNNLIRQLKVQN